MAIYLPLKGSLGSGVNGSLFHVWQGGTAGQRFTCNGLRATAARPGTGGQMLGGLPRPGLSPAGDWREDADRIAVFEWCLDSVEIRDFAPVFHDAEKLA